MANPQPANFDLEVIEPPLGMTGTQRATVLRALMLKEDRERAARRAADEKERAKAEAAGAPEGSKVLDEVAKEDVDWTCVRRPRCCLAIATCFNPLLTCRAALLVLTIGSNPTLPKLSPPLAVWWQQDDVASGSVDEVRHMIDRLKQDAWAGEGGGEPSITDKIKNWLS